MRKSRPHAGRTAPGQRQLRVAEQIRHLLVETLHRGSFHDPVLLEAHRVTVTAVEIGPDLKHATAYVMPLGGKDTEETLDALNRSAGYFRSELAPKMDLRYIPRITFKIDRSFDEAERIENLLKQDRVRRDVEKKERPLHEEDET
ncbi:MAG: 30S ribosome-binding factor RbfA [Alphaproteobacteria bacterium]|nr:30S ribosome-binding factor RbfA [Alphaproteobacteria bacterium]MDE2336949.1 30S ribosome-binding factor RbfA [Alphaproteobacteria bacterium]